MVNINVKYMSGYYNSTSMATSNYSTKPSTQHLSHTVAVALLLLHVCYCYRYSPSVDCRSCTYIHNHMMYYHSYLVVHWLCPTTVMSLTRELSPFLSSTSLYHYVSIQSNGKNVSKLNEYVMCKWCYLLPLTT